MCPVGVKILPRLSNSPELCIESDIYCPNPKWTTFFSTSSFWAKPMGYQNGLWSGFTRSLKVWGKRDQLWKWENWLVYVNFVVFRALWKYYQIIGQKLHFPKTKHITYFLSVLTENVLTISSSIGYAPLLDVQKSCMPSCCFSVPYCEHHARFLHLWIFKKNFCMNPGDINLSYWQNMIHHISSNPHDTE